VRNGEACHGGWRELGNAISPTSDGTAPCTPISSPPDYAYSLWSAETADNVYEMATDTQIVRGGKIVAQSFAGHIKPKR
jgi:hypothetical protein